MRYSHKLQPETALERNAARWLRAEARDRDGDIASVARDLFYGGCASGVVGHLIRYTDTLRFEARHRAEIARMVTEACADFGVSGVSEVFGKKWDADDPLGRGVHNRNLLAWFGFEGAARVVCERAAVDF